MRRQIEHLELRRLLSLPSELFADASDRYQITIGTAIPFTPITSLQWGVNNSGGTVTSDPLTVSMPSGQYSPQLFLWAVQGTNLQSVRAEELTTGGRVRTRWDLTFPFITSFAQATGSDGNLYDNFTINFRRMTETYFIPNPGGGADISTTFQWDFFSASGTNLSLADTSYMSTAPDVRSTFEVARGQLPLSSYAFSVTTNGTGPAVPNGPTFTAVASVDGLPLANKIVLPGTTGRLTDAVYIQRDDLARPVLRHRFADITPVHYGFSDTVQDNSPRLESWTFSPQKAQVISYTYAANGAMNPPVSNGWNFFNVTLYNPAPVTAFIQPPTFGPRNTPISSLDIQFSHPVTTLSLANFAFENINPASLTLTSSNGGLNWTIGNLAPQQVNGGSYGIKLFALNSGVTSGGVALIGSTGIHWTLDTSAPSVTSVAFDAAGAQDLRFGFSEDVSASLSVGDLTLDDLTTGASIDPASMSLVYDPATNTVLFAFPGLPGGVLPDGSYRATLSGAGVTDPAGNTLAGGDKVYRFIWANGTSGDDAFRVDLNATGNTVQVFKNSASPSFIAARSTLGTIALAGAGGNDSLLVDLVNGNPIAIDHLRFDGGTNGAVGDNVAFVGTAPVADSVTFNADSIHWIGSGDDGTIDSANVEAVQFDGKGGGDAVNLAGGPPLTFIATQHLASLTLAAATRAAMLGGGNRVLVTQALSLASTAALDLNDSDLVLDYSGVSQLAAVQQLINVARANGAWTGAGLTSFSARDNPQHNTTLGAIESSDFKAVYGNGALFSGEPIDATAVLVKYTWYGDSDFNGRVNFDDYVRTDAGFNNHRSGWLNGDFDGNGVVNFDDHVLIDLAFNTQGGTLGRGERRV